MCPLILRIYKSAHGQKKVFEGEHRFEHWYRDNRVHFTFDGCIRDETQLRRAYRYVLNQSVRHGICRRWEDYPHTCVGLPLEVAITRARTMRALLEGVPYARYDRQRRYRDTDRSANQDLHR